MTGATSNPAAPRVTPDAHTHAEPDVEAPPRPCTIDGCDTDTRNGGRGMCRPHYQDWYRRNREIYTRTCPTCDTPFETKYPRRRRYCSSRCRAAAAPPPPPPSSDVRWRPCTGPHLRSCVGWVARPGKTTRCAPCATSRRATPLPPSTTCPECGTTIDHDTRRGRPRVYCSAACSRRAQRRDPNRNRGNQQDQRRRRRARERGAAVESFTTTEIYERDRWRCQLCHRKVNPDIPLGHARSATLDHVVPLAHGGLHTRANVQLAHRRCNLRKGDRVLGPGEQLSLIG